MPCHYCSSQIIGVHCINISRIDNLRHTGWTQHINMYNKYIVFSYSESQIVIFVKKIIRDEIGMYASGSEKRKKAAETAERHAEFMQKVRNLSTFFKRHDNPTATPIALTDHPTDSRIFVL